MAKDGGEQVVVWTSLAVEQIWSEYQSGDSVARNRSLLKIEITVKLTIFI